MITSLTLLTNNNIIDIISIVVAYTPATCYKRDTMHQGRDHHFDNKNMVRELYTQKKKTSTRVSLLLLRYYH
jgi:hypothetical protein